ncbi:hypothetical protein AHAS_Ahas03G0298600 [Arachis hypogaea]
MLFRLPSGYGERCHLWWLVCFVAMVARYDRTYESLTVGREMVLTWIMTTLIAINLLNSHVKEICYRGVRKRPWTLSKSMTLARRTSDSELSKLQRGQRVRTTQRQETFTVPRQRPMVEEFLNNSNNFVHINNNTCSPSQSSTLDSSSRLPPLPPSVQS